MATFGYEYQAQTVWLADLSTEKHPATYDLCRVHGDGLRVPRGWQLRDVRHGVQAPLRVVVG